MALARKVIEMPVENYHGLPVLTLRVGDPLPAPPCPARYAVRIGPDLARYLLTFNIANNRGRRDRKIVQMAADMAAGRWQLSPQCPYFSVSGDLINGQNTLYAITEAAGMKPGLSVWCVLDFGWQDDLVYVIDRGTARNAADDLHMASIHSPATLAAIASRVWQLTQLMGTDRSFSGFAVPSGPAILEMVRSDQAAFEQAGKVGKRTYERLDKAAGPSVWGSIYYLAAKESSEGAEAFFSEIAEGTGEPRSATRALADWFRRRPISATKTGDSREPFELVIRAYNAWSRGKSFAFPKYRGFTLSNLRPR